MLQKNDPKMLCPKGMDGFIFLNCNFSVFGLEKCHYLFVDNFLQKSKKKMGKAWTAKQSLFGVRSWIFDEKGLQVESSIIYVAYFYFFIR